MIPPAAPPDPVSEPVADRRAESLAEPGGEPVAEPGGEGPTRRTVLAAAGALAGVALLARPGVGRANIFGRDDRIWLERAPGSVWGAVGVVTQPDGVRPLRFGTATLVGPRHALTAHHIAFPTAAAAGPGVASLVHLGPPRADFPFTATIAARPVAWGDMGAHVNADWALLELAEPAGEVWGWWPVDALATEAATARPGGFRSAGHPAWGRRDRVAVDPACTVWEATGSVPAWRMDCAVRVGVSGGPVFVDGAAADRPRLTAIVKGDFFPTDAIIPGWDRRAANIAVPATTFRERIARHLGTP